MADRDVLKELSSADSLPTLPDVVTRVLAELDHDEVEVRRVADLISQDPAITGQLLRAANSVMFTASGMATSSIQEAVGRLGLREVRNLIVSLGVVRAFDEPEGFDYREFWRHSFSSAVASGTVAQQLAHPPPPIARDNPYFLAGLLHDVGTLLLCHELGREYLDLLVEAVGNELPLEEYEHERLGADHQQVGAALIRRWGLPLEVSAAAEFHHRPEDAPDDGRDYVLVVTAADALLGSHGRGSPAEPETTISELAMLPGLDAARMEALTQKVMEAAESSDALLAVALAP